MIEQKKFSFNNVEIIKTKKRKTISLQITKEAKIVLRTPYYAKKEDINKLITQHLKWIQKKQQEIKLKIISNPQKTFVEEEDLLYLGKKYPLKYSSSIKSKILLDEKYFYLNTNKKDKEYLKKIFINWYKKQAKSIISDRVVYYAENYNFNYKTIRLSSAKTRWGSCSNKKNLNFVWKLVMAPLEIIDYVVIHELVHTEEMHHQKTFWNKVANIMPDYKTHRKWLKNHGYLLSI